MLSIMYKNIFFIKNVKNSYIFALWIYEYNILITKILSFRIITFQIQTFYKKISIFFANFILQIQKILLWIYFS